MKLQELVEGPLLGPEGEQWKKEPRQMPEEYENWVDAQIFSDQASQYYANFQDVIYPLTKTRQKATLEELWTIVDNVCATLASC